MQLTIGVELHPATVQTSAVHGSPSSHRASSFTTSTPPPLQTSVVQGTLSCGGVSVSSGTVTTMPPMHALRTQSVLDVCGGGHALQADAPLAEKVLAGQARHVALPGLAA